MNKLDSAGIIFILTAVGYVLTFTYQWGYYAFYHLPASLIDIQITTIIRNILFIVAIFGSGTFFHIFMKESDLKNSRVAKLLTITKGDESKRNGPIVSQTICVLIFVGCIGMFFYGETEKYLYLLMAAMSFTSYCVVKRYKNISLITFAVTSFLASFYIGFLNADDRTDYMKIEGTDYIVLDFYKDAAISARFNDKKNILYPEYQFVKLETPELGTIHFKLIKIDNLKVSKYAKTEK